ncbi:MAG: GNAT superfamily N-acetyltransferase [Planctomycetota bacterium]|jgi:GNAT superfamily N-acetyltransferase
MASPWAVRALAAELQPRLLDRSLAAQHMMAAVLRDGAPLAADYPLVFGEQSPGRIAVIEDARGLALSACALLSRDFHIGERCLRVGMIGSVATDPDQRGRGMASRVLDAAHKELARMGCLFSLLWAEDPAFYEGRGYRTIGRELDFYLPAGRRPIFPAPDGVRNASAKDFAAIRELHAKHPTRVERSVHEMQQLLSVPGMEILVQEIAGEITAYACRGRGEDMRDVVHEWGGSTAGVMACLAGHMACEGQMERDFVVLAAPDSSDAASALTEACLEVVPGVLGMAHLLNRTAAERLLSEFAPEARDFAEDLTDAELLELLFTPSERTTVRAALEASTGQAPAGLPLNPFAWGLDSI